MSHYHRNILLLRIMKLKKTITRTDLLILIAVLITAGIMLIITNSNEPAIADIIIKGETVHSADLSSVKEDYTLTLDNGITVEISEGKIKIISSDCNGKDCIKCGELSSPGDMAVCVPNFTVIKLRGAEKAPLDAITY